MITKTKIKVDLTPDKKIYERLGFGQHEIHDAIAELIDNSLDARTEEQEKRNEPLKIKINARINVKIGQSLYANSIEIEDNASGMDEETAKNCLIIAKTSRERGKQGRYGVGLKSSCLSIGKKFTIITKQKESNKKYIIEFDNSKFTSEGKWDEFFMEEVIDDGDWHGTKIKITDFWEKKLIYYLKMDNLRKRFEWIFGPFIKNNQINLIINNSLVKGKDLTSIKIESKKNINLEIDTPLSSGKKIKVTGWFGFREGGGSTLGYSGFNLFRNKRLIKTWEQIGYRYHAETRLLMGELNLDDFPVSIDKKDFIRSSDQWRDLAGEYKYDKDGNFAGHDNKTSMLYPLIIELLREHKEKTALKRKEKNVRIAMNEVEERKKYFENIGKRKEKLEHIRKVLSNKVINHKQNKDIYNLETVSKKDHKESKIDAIIQKYEEEQKQTTKELLPKSFLETKKIKIDGKEYFFNQSANSLDITKPYLYKIKGKKIIIDINLNYPFIENLKKDFSLYYNIMTLLGLSEAIAEIKKENLKEIQNKLFEIYSRQSIESEKLRKGDLTKIDEEIFKVSF